jgi:replication factor C subunit 2/4
MLIPATPRISPDTNVTRFCIICNYVSRIIEPIASRCAKFRFQPLSEEAMVGRLEHISTSESLNVGPGTLDTLVKVSEGDLRRAITLLESSSRLLLDGEALAPEHVRETAGVIPASVVDKLMHSCRMNSFTGIEQAATDAIADGFPVNQLLDQ